MAKAKKQKRAPNLSPLALLRPRLDGLIMNPNWSTGDMASIHADLTAVVKGLAAHDYLPVVLKSVNDAEPATHEQLTHLLPAWLQQMAAVDDLVSLVEHGTLQPQESLLAANLVQACGVKIAPVEAGPEHHFHSAYYGADELGSQGFLIILWYANRQKSRLRGLNFLIDFNPPWDGAVKDVTILPQRSPDDMLTQFVDIWRSREVYIAIDKLDAVATKQRMIEALACNRAQTIRLPRDLVAIRDLFLHHVLALPDDPNTPPFTLEDFDTLAQTGAAAEALMRVEKTVGRRVRMEDGRELLVMPGSLDEE
jgi:hypothetical protein